MKDGKVQYVGIQASEKVAYNVTVTATGTSGHGSMPQPDNAVVHLAAAVEKLGTYQVPAQPSTITLRYFEQLAKIEDDEIAKWMRALEQPERADLAVKHLSEESPMWNSMLRDTIAPTMLQAGVRVNVVPSEATANLNIRMLPGHSIEELMGQFAKIVNDPQIRFQLAPDSGENAPPSDITTPLYQDHRTHHAAGISGRDRGAVSFHRGHRFREPAPSQSAGLWPRAISPDRKR